MVKVRFLLSLGLVGLLMFTSCAKDSSTSTSTDSYTFTAKVDGTAWDGTATAVASNKSLGGLQPFTLSGYANGLTIGLSVAQLSDTGSRGFDAQFRFNTATITDGSKTWSTAYGSSWDNGTIHITKLTSTMAEGTFDFTAINSSDTTNKRRVTDGKFTVKLQ
ncbi:MAG: hypothetical protein U0264_11810 [Candidatus Kapaibacterium sp.]